MVRCDQFHQGINFHKYFHINFVQDPAVDEEVPLREFLHLLMLQTTLFSVELRIVVFQHPL